MSLWLYFNLTRSKSHVIAQLICLFHTVFSFHIHYISPSITHPVTCVDISNNFYHFKQSTVLYSQRRHKANSSLLLVSFTLKNDTVYNQNIPRIGFYKCHENCSHNFRHVHNIAHFELNYLQNVETQYFPAPNNRIVQSFTTMNFMLLAGK